MANALSRYTDQYEQPDGLPVEQLTPGGVPIGENGLPRVVIGNQPTAVEDDGVSATVKRITDKLLGLNGQERYQLWPEKLIREAITTPGDVAAGKIPQYAVDPETGDVHTSPQMVEGAQAVSALAGSGGLASVTDGTLGSAPFLRPALKYKDKLYKGKEGQGHQDVIPEALYPDFQKKAMSGEDINDYKFGFVNDKGHFLDRENALKYGIDTGIVDPQAGKYGALTSTLMADSSKPGTAIESMAKTNQPTFYSALEHQVNAVGQPKMTGDQWLGTLGNKPGVKPEELDWTGLKDFLTENKGKSVTKEQVKEYLDSNKVELKEVSKGNPLTKEEQEWLDDAHNRRLDSKEASRYEELNAKSQSGSNTKYHDYQLPGGENYREVLMTLPEKFNPLQVAEKRYMEIGNEFNKNGKIHTDTQREWDDLSDEIGKLRKQGMKGINEIETANNYRSSHWDEPNVLAHMRMNDRTIDGKKSLHLEEVQSDWHQDGRKKGYKVTDAERKRYDELKYKNDTDQTPEDLKFVQDMTPKIVNNHAVPDAPFKKNWHELALKRAIAEAAEKGYERLSWTPGEAQAARYDLSKQVDKIAVPMVNEGGSRSVRIDAKGQTPFKLMVDKNGVVEGQGASSSQFSGKPLSDVVGKEMAEKIMKLDKPNEFSGDGLKIGGEGMKGFYDQIIPKSVEKLTKEHGVKVKQSEPEVYKGVGGYTYEGADKVFKTREDAAKAAPKLFYIDIPQSLKDQVMKKGQPLFSANFPAYQFIPYDGNPFEDTTK